MILKYAKYFLIMPRQKGKSKNQLSYRIPSDVELKMDKLIANKEFNTRSDIISTAIRFYLDHREFNIEEEIESYLNSEKGERYIKNQIEKCQNAT